ncbi:ER lumen protein retaining receptor-domain-containing protein [Xylariaceae sp. FL0804]|nr:ER lumen protein retaining receptor-domain-containing protein [Xylariaceae sp. FL0804]
MGWNIFRILGDCSHLLSKCILIFAIHRNRSAEGACPVCCPCPPAARCVRARVRPYPAPISSELTICVNETLPSPRARYTTGVSMITQGLYAVVFCSRYTDFFTETSSWNYFFKLFYILSSIYIIVIMRWLYPRTREREIAWKLGALCLGGSLLLSPFAMLIFEGKRQWSFFTWVWDFSQILESVCVLPQLLLLRQTAVPTVIDSFYLLTLGSYRALYCLNWVWREFDPNDRKPNAVSVVFGLVQTALYLDFFWVYYSRQRVKLRAGGVVDQDDIRRGWLLRRVFGNKRFAAADADGVDGDEESAPALGGRRNGDAAASHQQQQRRSKWGARGISISADDPALEQDLGNGRVDEFSDAAVDPDAKMRDPDELARALDGDDDDDDDDGLPPAASSAMGGGNEWRST